MTGGSDKLVKVWNIEQNEGGKNNVSLVQSRDLGVVRSSRLPKSRHERTYFSPQGKVFSTSFSPDSPLTVAAGGSKAKLQIWDVASNAGARKAFGGKLREAGKVLSEKSAEEARGGVVGLVSDGEESDGDDDEDE